MLSSPRYLNMPGRGHVAHARPAGLPCLPSQRTPTFPWRSHADWFLAQMVRWEQAPADTDIEAVADRVYRTDIYRAAARDMGIACPMSTACRRAAMANRLLPASDDQVFDRDGCRRRARLQLTNFEAFTFQESSHEATARLGRRDILKGATATAALMGAVRASFPAGAFAQAAGPETNKVTLGFIALTDAAPLIIAKEKKLFDKYGITDANVAKQASWGTTRDNMVLGSAAGGIDGAHILTPLPYLITLGTVTPENKPMPMYILARLNYRLPGHLGRQGIQGHRRQGSTPRRSRKPSPRRRRRARK